MERVTYARNGDVNIAYVSMGTGPPDLVWVQGAATNVAVLLDDPDYRAFCERLAAFSRFILFDKRGMGLSERVEAGTMEDRMDDVRAIMDDAGSERAVIIGVSEGALMAELFAATHPDRTQALILIGGEVREENDEEWQWGDGTRQWFEERMADWSHWGEGRVIRVLAPSLADDPQARAWWGRVQLMSGNPRTIEAHARVAFDSDMRSVLTAIRVPTLVIHRTDDRAVRVEQGRYIANHIPGARYVELPGVDHLPWVEGGDIADEIEEFVTGSRPAAMVDRVLATVMFSDIVDSTLIAARVGDRRWSRLLEEHNAAVRRELQRNGGTEIDTAGDGFLASFVGPARAIRCGLALHRAVAPLDLRLRVGLHTGEVERMGHKLSGIAVHTGARVAALAGPGEVLVSSTVRDLVAGSGIEFVDRGTHALKGVPGEWRIYAVTS
jgi:pimeloyl-ACP methyl ester carboxylesterase